MTSDSLLTLLEYALLGLVRQRAMSGYDIGRLFEETPLAHFSSSPGAIYPALKRLDSRGLLQAEMDSATEARPRRLYSLTTAGARVLDDWLRQPVSREEVVRRSDTPILRFSLMEGLPSDRILDYLRGYRDVLESYLAEVEGYISVLDDPDRVHTRLSLEYGMAGLRSEIEWIDRAVKRLGQV